MNDLLVDVPERIILLNGLGITQGLIITLLVKKSLKKRISLMKSDQFFEL